MAEAQPTRAEVAEVRPQAEAGKELAPQTVKELRQKLEECAKEDKQCRTDARSSMAALAQELAASGSRTESPWARVSAISEETAKANAENARIRSTQVAQSKDQQW